MIRPRLILSLGLLASSSALADANITVDAMTLDWSTTTTCQADPAGDSANGIDLTRVCQENDNSSGNAGYLFGLYEAANGFGNSTDRYFGFILDLNNDGVITSADEVWAVHFAGNSQNPDFIGVFTPVTYNLTRSYTSTASCGGSGTANGWSARQRNSTSGNAPRGVVELRVAYGCLGLSSGNDNRRMQFGVYPNFDVLTEIYYDGTANTITPVGAPPAPISFTITSGATQNRLFWTNPTPHLGTLVLRSTGSQPNTAPTPHQTYGVGASVGNATVRYVDDNGSSVNTFSDTGLTNGTRYFYRIYNHHQNETYSVGVVPSSNPFYAEPTAQTGASPLWCYSVGFPTLQQPTTEVGSRVFTASNSGAVTASQTLPGATDGWEAWRPRQLSGAIQSRPTLVPLINRTGNYLVTADQSGFGHLVRTSDGALMWSTIDLGDVIQGQPVAQLYAYAGAGFRAQHPNRDLLFFATRNNSNNNNAVYAVSSVDGSIIWTYRPGNLNIVAGGMAVDYARDRLWVASATNNSSVRVISTLTGAQVTQLNLGPITYGVNLRFVGGVATEAVVINNAGTVYGVDLQTMTVRWSRTNVGTPTGWTLPLNTGVIATVSGNVRRIDVLPDAGTALVWSAAVPGASGVTFDYTNEKIYVGGSLNRLREITWADGGIKTLTMPGTTTDFGHPTIDPVASRLHVGTLDGRLCAFPVPFP